MEGTLRAGRQETHTSHTQNIQGRGSKQADVLAADEREVSRRDHGLCGAWSARIGHTFDDECFENMQFWLVKG
jgi:hypothetical protein